jgi:8-oxo-dGTP pyrophosphatase MutT (NUDIX family)
MPPSVRDTNLSSVQELRALVGSRPLILPSAGALVFDEAGRVLLQRRADDGTWNIPGGAIEPGEALEQTAKREVREETGLDIGDLKLLCVLSGRQFFHVYPSGDAVYHVAAIYVAERLGGIASTNNAEATETRFFDLSETPSNVNLISKCALDRYRAARIVDASEG